MLTEIHDFNDGRIKRFHLVKRLGYLPSLSLALSTIHPVVRHMERVAFTTCDALAASDMANMDDNC